MCVWKRIQEPSLYTYSGGYTVFLSPSLRMKVVGPIEVGVRIMRNTKLFSVLHPHMNVYGFQFSCNWLGVHLSLIAATPPVECRGRHTVFAFVSYC